MALRCGFRNGGLQDGGGGRQKKKKSGVEAREFFFLAPPPPPPPGRGLLDYGYLERASLGTECPLARGDSSSRTPHSFAS